MPKNIGILLPYLKRGGTETQAFMLMKALKGRDLNARLLVCEKSGGYLSEISPDDGIFLGLKFKKRNVLLLVLRAVIAIMKNDFQLVISRAWKTNWLAFVSACLTGRKFAVFVSSGFDNPCYSFPIKLFYLMMFNRANGIFCVSEQGALNVKRYFGCNFQNLIIAKNGVVIPSNRRSLMSSLSSWPEGKFRISFAGRLVPVKGLDILIESIRILKLKNMISSGVIVRVIGEGEFRDHYKRLVSLYMIDCLFEFVGEVEDVRNYLLGSDVFVLPSRAEGFPNVLLEAMSLGLPVVAADCMTGPKEIITHGEDGLLFAVEDSVDLANKLALLHSDDQYRRHLGQAAHTTVKAHFSIEQRIDVVVDYLSNVVGCRADFNFRGD